MEQYFAKATEILHAIAMMGMIISILATIIVRITPSKTDDDTVSEWVKKMMKVLQWLPTIGVNPQTKKLEEAYQELKAKQDEKPS